MTGEGAATQQDDQVTKWINAILSLADHPHERRVAMAKALATEFAQISEDLDEAVTISRVISANHKKSADLIVDLIDRFVGQLNELKSGVSEGVAATELSVRIDKVLQPLTMLQDVFRAAANRGLAGLLAVVGAAN